MSLHAGLGVVWLAALEDVLVGVGGCTDEVQWCGVLALSLAVVSGCVQ